MGRVLTNNTSLAYAIETAIGALDKAVAATGLLTLTANAADGETVEVGGQTYTFESGALDVADEVLLGGDADSSLDNLVAAINASAAGAGVQYEATTVENASVYALRGAGLTMIVVAKTPGTAGNAVTTTETLGSGSWGGATLAGGLDVGDVGAFEDEWKLTEPNAINTLGADITTVARDPISNRRQRRKGAVTDLDSAVEFEADLTFDSFEDFIEGWTFATAVNGDLVRRGSVISNGQYHFAPPLTAEQAAKLIVSGGAATLVEASGYVTDANNGLKALTSAPGEGGSSLAVAGLTDETPASNAIVKLAGLRGDDLTWDWTAASKTAELISAGDVTDWAALGLTPGQVIHIGSKDASGDVQNAFENALPNDMFGAARVVSISGGTVVLDKVDAALQFDDLTAPATLDVMFGRFFRNVPVDDDEFLERSFQFEAQWINLADPGPGDEYEYSEGNFCNTLAFNLPLTDKATATFGFIGTDTPVPTGTRKVGADSARQPAGTGAFNTSNDIARLRIQQLDEDGLTTDFKSLTLTLNNNVSPEKVLGVLGARFMNAGNFDVDIEAQVLFSNAGVVAAIRSNETVTMDFIIKNDDGGLAVDIPAMTIGGGDKELPVNESVLINTTELAFEDPILGTSIGISELPFIP